MNGYDREASIIIPTYNRFELLEFTLLSLYKQSISAKNFEVIVIDDGSTDQTRKLLTKMHPPYKLVALHNKANRGAAYSRNQGIRLSRGETIIFLDEMLVGLNFVESHLRYHSRKNMVVTTHYNGQRIFTHYYPNFPKRQKRKCQNFSMKISSIRHPTGKNGVLRLFSKKEVINHRILRYGFQDRIRPQWFHSLQAAYGKYLERMASPWFLFITNGVSVPKKLLYKAGLFDEKLKTWMEDWELGYRLHLAGAAFYNACDIACYHQNHPAGRSLKNKLANYFYFIQKHPVVEVLLVPAISPAVFNWSVEKLGKIITQFKELENHGNNLNRDFTAAFRELAEALSRHVARLVNNSAPPLLKSAEAGFDRWEPDFAGRVKKQLAQLEQESLLSGNYRELVEGFKDLLRLPLKNI